MAQFRLTQKFAKDIGLSPSQLQAPCDATALLDDWLVDIMRIARKKVAVLMHAKTLFSFPIPYADVGARNG